MSKPKIGLALLLAMLCLSVTAQAGNVLAVRKQVESSLLVSGLITIAPDGSVVAHTLDSTDALGAALTKFVDGSLETWHFKPVIVDGKVVTAKVPMSLRLVAKPMDDGNMSVTIASTYFGRREELPATADVRKAKWTPPQYPQGALRVGGKGTVYLIVQVGRDGAVINVDAEQVNLKVLGTDREMDDLRKQFADSAVRAAKHWRFVPPTTSVAANEASWLVRIPVSFVLSWEKGAKRQKAGTWDSYVPGPRNMDMPWAREELQAAGGPDAVSEGGVYPLEQGATLINPPAA